MKTYILNTARNLSIKSSLFLFLFFCISAHAKESAFFLSSETIVRQKQGPLKNLEMFSFIPLLKMEGKQADKVMHSIHKALQNVGTIVEKPIFTPEGADLSTFSNPTLQLRIEQIVDSQNIPLPVLKIELSIDDVVEFFHSKELAAIPTNQWIIYAPITTDLDKLIQTTFPKLLDQFIIVFRQANPNLEKPTFYINYDKSWWHSKKT
ncbi:MAG: hypothetical protein RLZZ453_389 [Chlamydiota bacterium]|jgi:hypothetical protein